MTFRGDSISLRAVEPGDADHLYRWENDATMWNNCSTIAPYSKYHLEEYIKTAGDIYALRQLRLMVVLNAEPNTTIGCVDLFDYEPRYERAEVAVLIDKDYRQKGYAKEALLLLEHYAFHFLNLHQLYAYIGESNWASLALFSSLEYSKSAFLKDWFRVDEEWESCWLVQKFKEKGNTN